MKFENINYRRKFRNKKNPIIQKNNNYQKKKDKKQGKSEDRRQNYAKKQGNILFQYFVVPEA